MGRGVEMGRGIGIWWACSLVLIGVLFWLLGYLNQTYFMFLYLMFFILFVVFIVVSAVRAARKPSLRRRHKRRARLTLPRKRRQITQEVRSLENELSGVVVEQHTPRTPHTTTLRAAPRTSSTKNRRASRSKKSAPDIQSKKNMKKESRKKYACSLNSEKYHLSTCRILARVPPKERRYFSSPGEAESRGYLRARCCPS
ncbi:hypothetical protein COY95_03025 [Candidatus Woesearchaeota archaeon CG_4_10_14_0_8_um_filter_47_5]|nr:MAG: hypothetical protein COY95_03025 [Candidatus Woesearchaeota archaeon CG_4_10_14_0_8_um_filter_47_5]